MPQMPNLTPAQIGDWEKNRVWEGSWKTGSPKPVLFFAPHPPPATSFQDANTHFYIPLTAILTPQPQTLTPSVISQCFCTEVGNFSEVLLGCFIFLSLRPLKLLEQILTSQETRRQAQLCAGRTEPRVTWALSDAAWWQRESPSRECGGGRVERGSGTAEMNAGQGILTSGRSRALKIVKIHCESKWFYGKRK